MTQGEFFLVLARMVTRYRGVKAVLTPYILPNAIEYGLDIDEDGPEDELQIIARPLEVFLAGVVADMDMLYQSATACLVWEAYQKYLEQKISRDRITALTKQSRRRHAK